MKVSEKNLIISVSFGVMAEVLIIIGAIAFGIRWTTGEEILKFYQVFIILFIGIFLRYVAEAFKP